MPKKKGYIMSSKNFERRDFIKTILGGIPIIALDWSSFPWGGNTLQ